MKSTHYLLLTDGHRAALVNVRADRTDGLRAVISSSYTRTDG